MFRFLQAYAMKKKKMAAKRKLEDMEAVNLAKAKSRRKAVDDGLQNL
jgi:hypothetical protein